MRQVFELAGIPNIVGKNQGSSNKLNVVRSNYRWAFKSLRKLQITEKKTAKRP